MFARLNQTTFNKKPDLIKLSSEDKADLSAKNQLRDKSVMYFAPIWSCGASGGITNGIYYGYVTCQTQYTWLPDPYYIGTPYFRGGGYSLPRGGGGGGRSTPKPQPVEEDRGAVATIPQQKFLNKIDATNLKPCMQTILNDIKKLSNGSVAGIIQKFAEEVPGYNWKMKDGELSNGLNGSTSSQYDRATGTVTTTFDSQKFTLASDLSVARTILHESVHAYLVAYFNSDPLNAYKTYAQIVIDWEKSKRPNLNDIQHNEMIRSFINDIATSLKEYGTQKGYNLSDQFYKDMAWGGLTHDHNGNQTQLFKELIPNISDRSRILNTIQTEQYKTDTQGNPQTPKGNLAGC